MLVSSFCLPSSDLRKTLRVPQIAPYSILRAGPSGPGQLNTMGRSGNREVLALARLAVDETALASGTGAGVLVDADAVALAGVALALYQIVPVVDVPHLDLWGIGRLAVRVAAARAWGCDRGCGR